METTAVPDAGLHDRADAVARRVTVKLRTIIAMLFGVMFVGLLDRSNAGFASLTMNGEIGMSPAQFGLGLGLFSAGEALFSVPSNRAAVKFRPHRWLALLVLVWGCLAMAMAAIGGPHGFYLLRFLLGVAEAGTVPCIMLIVAGWIPPRMRARSMAIIVAGSGLAAIVGPPLGAAIFAVHWPGGFSGWRWLFLVEGGMTLVLAALLLRWLPAEPEKARWLDAGEREWLVAELAREPAASSSDAPPPEWNSTRAALIGVLNFAVAASASVLAVWLPQVARETMHLTITQVGLISAPVYGLGVLGAIVVGGWSDRHGGRLTFMAAFSALAAFALAVTALAPVPAVSFAALVASVVAIRCTGGVFFAAIAEGIHGRSRGHAFGLVVMFGSLGGFCGNWLFGVMRELTGTFSGGIAGLGAMMTLTAIAAWLAGRPGATARRA